MAEKRVALALGGGAAKGLAHVGVLKGLEEDGIEVAAIAGTSMGSIVGALHARGMGGAEMEAFFSSVDWVRLGRIMMRSPGGAAFRDLLRETFGGKPIEELAIPFAAVCCDLSCGEEVVLREGSLADAILASSAIPGILPPSVIGGRTLVDGAFVTPVPVSPSESLSAAPVLAVNVLRPPSSERAFKPVIKRLLDGHRAGSASRSPGVLHRPPQAPDRAPETGLPQPVGSRDAILPPDAVQPLETGEAGDRGSSSPRSENSDGSSSSAHRKSSRRVTAPIVRLRISLRSEIAGYLFEPTKSQLTTSQKCSIYSARALR